MVERVLERMLFLSRWLMAPFFIGLVGMLALMMVKFMQELYHLAPRILELDKTDIILLTLSLLDVTLVASLVLMMIFSGYENFVPRIDVAGSERPAWMGSLDFSGLKLKLIAAIVAISGIDLLRRFVNIEQIDKADMMWLVVTHIAFVISGVLLALMDYLTERAKKLHDEY
jgi:uncharacterized protein (TIGR00645 family)